MPKFAVRLFIKRDGSTTPSEYDGKLHYFNMSVLTDKEKKGKPPNTFRFLKRTFLYVPTAVKAFTPKGVPIIKYEISNSIPNDGVAISPITEPELEQTPEEKKIASDLLDVTFARGEEKAVIAGSQKTKDEFSLKTFIIGAVTGSFAGGFIVIILVMQHVIHIA